MRIDWDFPPPRTGLKGILDKFVGPGATRAEMALQFGFAIPAAIIAPVYAAQRAGGWSAVQYVICSLLALDIVGGIITNATSSAKRWYHRPGQGFRQHFGFSALHLIHLFVVSWLYLRLDMIWFGVTGGYLLLSVIVVLLVPQYLRRPVSLIAYVGGLILSMYLLPQPAGLEWFLPLFYLKLLVSHILKEEPYRPV